MNILVSACLLGVCSRYDGTGNLLPELEAMVGEGKHVLIPFCPEVYGGLPTPRVPAERIRDRVVARDGQDVTAQYEKGAAEALRLAQLYGCRLAVLKERSPSCGYGKIYDGSFSGILTEGNGTAAEKLAQAGIEIIGETELKRFRIREKEQTDGCDERDTTVE